MSWSAIPFTTNPTQSSPTRRRRRRPADSSCSTTSREEESFVSSSSFSIMRNSLVRPLSGRSASFGAIPSSTLPTHQGELTGESLFGTNSSNPPRYNNNNKSHSKSSAATSTFTRCIRSPYLKPSWIIQVLGLLALGNFVYFHFYFLSMTHQRSLFTNTSHPSSSAGRLFEAILSPTGTSLYQLDPTAMFASRPLSPQWLQERREARVQRTRPGFVDAQSLAPAGVSRQDYPILNVTANDDTDWKQLCKQANMNEGSRVLIVNLLSHPTGAALAKLIAKQCGVQQVTGADPMLPNLRKTRMKLMDVQKELIRKIPSLQSIVTEPGMGLHEKNRLQPLAWMDKVRPTHVLLLDPVESPVLVESLGGMPSFEIFARQQLRHVWQDLSTTVQQLPTRVLHVASPLLGKISQAMGLTAISTWDARIPFSFATLSMGALSGPGILSELFPESSQPIFVDQGLRAMMMGWQRPKQVFAVNLLPQPLTVEESLETSIWEDHVARPFSLTAPSSNQTVILKTRQRLLNMGNDPVVLPCASQCQATSSLRSCSATVWDHAIGPGVAATEGCEYVLFMANFSLHLAEVPEHVPDPSLCRVFYISRKSQLAKTFKVEKNGKVSSNEWILVWIDATDKSFSANDSALVRIDPSRLFSQTVRKAMYVNTVAFASAPDVALMNIMTQIDQPAVGEGERSIRDVRPGTDLKRWKPLPAEPARRVALFGGAPLPENRPETLPDYKEMMDNAVSQRQIAFYLQLAHWVHVNLDRPESEIRGTVYLKFPFEWTSRYFVVHDLSLEAARELRCNWLQEHWTWNAKQSFWDTEDLSLAFVLGAMKTVGKLGLPNDEADGGWIPFWNGDEEGRFEGKDQVYLRLMQPRED